jgi:hypothetical protein
VPTISLSATTLPPPIQISLSDILNKVSTKKPQLLLPTVNNAAPVNGMKDCPQFNHLLLFHQIKKKKDENNNIRSLSCVACFNR